MSCRSFPKQVRTIFSNERSTTAGGSRRDLEVLQAPNLEIPMLETRPSWLDSSVFPPHATDCCSKTVRIRFETWEAAKKHVTMQLVAQVPCHAQHSGSRMVPCLVQGLGRHSRPVECENVSWDFLRKPAAPPSPAK